MGVHGLQIKKRFCNVLRQREPSEFIIWWAVQDLNLWHLPCKGSALPTELTAHNLKFIISTLYACQEQKNRCIIASRQYPGRISSDTVHVAVVEKVFHGLVGLGDVLLYGIGLPAFLAAHVDLMAGTLDGHGFLALRAGNSCLGLACSKKGHDWPREKRVKKNQEALPKGPPGGHFRTRGMVLKMGFCQTCAKAQGAFAQDRQKLVYLVADEGGHIQDGIA